MRFFSGERDGRLIGYPFHHLCHEGPYILDNGTPSYTF